MVTRLKGMMESTAEVRNKAEIELRIKALEEAKCSNAWTANLMKRNCIHSSKGLGENGHLDAKPIADALDMMQRKLETYDVANISNTDEVAVLYRSYPSRAIRSSSDPAIYKRVKNRITATLTVLQMAPRCHYLSLANPKNGKLFPGTWIPYETLVFSTKASHLNHKFVIH
ncbi:hypothetical protein BWQ96_09591 [Gracilariopsis chorda]|uniref:Uncharacterized protein n=1 Tax=Gracilariopsis chorda TaxID=448386 RepID=A0A2V3IF25_9FLOR|nr:hypothetical protein BWQ96_09591 [Gracilariopsis chorda]|eukprot:PXF40689.1 hypothetical protein BWQ96_09591 [Gracilariopsis chorda]